MTPRRWHCFGCGSRWETDANGELVDHSLVGDACVGCWRLLAILNTSAALRSELPPEPEPAQDLSPTSILARLMAGRQPTRDWAKAASNDSD